MKTLIVISKLSFVPSNCYDFLKCLMLTNKQDIAGVVVLQTAAFTKIPAIVKLYLSGCIKLANTYLLNLLKLPFDEREKLFAGLNVPVIKAKDMNDRQVVKWIKNNKIDLVVNMRTTCIYRKEVLKAPKYGCINIHHGLLPKYRGRYSDLYAIYEKRRAGFTVHKMIEKVDSGEIYLRKYISKVRENDYVKYLTRLPYFEANAISYLIACLKRNGQIPVINSKKPGHYIYTKNPDNKTIAGMLKSGLIL